MHYLQNNLLFNNTLKGNDGLGNTAKNLPIHAYVRKKFVKTGAVDHIISVLKAHTKSRVTLIALGLFSPITLS